MVGNSRAGVLSGRENERPTAGSSGMGLIYTVEQKQRG